MNTRLGIVRRLKGISVNQVVNDLGFVKSTFLRWERGSLDIRLSDAAKLAKYYGVSLDYLAFLSDDSDYCDETSSNDCVSVLVNALVDYSLSSVPLYSRWNDL